MVDLVAEGHLTQGDRLVGIEHVSELDSVCVASRGGEVLTCNFLSDEVCHTMLLPCMNACIRESAKVFGVSGCIIVTLIRILE